MARKIGGKGSKQESGDMILYLIKNHAKNWMIACSRLALAGAHSPSTIRNGQLPHNCQLSSDSPFLSSCLHASSLLTPRHLNSFGT